ncbi:nicotinate-nucleotide pyrophosphorylase [carboxylating] [Caloranaerobacter azorensis DSM 13643]|uniref:Probable nicotinate-nucleotide pyrophosphorylase [carboxylating] n=1 Tax=Caloranaerobacter azorensis DSM 13643 TaxID=1121264 RepID=A0A1M5RGL5_9FIRM|nr:carboxylating nicotinate-nucleotide diphosphorylase [Caloranaerobacter azorensis]SHH25507.1 nicotinate-nucleotide pyrophosphorylase [carboxylating] [Caloranaerobacter azorensis DSM 13643]
MLVLQIEDIIKNALLEDMNNGDITTENLIGLNDISEAEIIAKEDGVLAGIEIAEITFKLLDKDMLFYRLKEDGQFLRKGDVIAKIKGKTRAILSGERTALNFLQRLSGIATKTKKFVDKVEKYNVRVADTRKTTPGIRALEKYAVRLGGGANHRYNLSDAVMIKDNHIRAVGSIEKAIKLIRERVPHTVKVEVEVETIEQFKQALDAGADIIMLDNMSIEDMKEAVNINNKKAILEASGNVNIDNIEEVAKTGVDVISVGALTHSVKSLDISLNIK